jgi:hypothetical protein
VSDSKHHDEEYNEEHAATQVMMKDLNAIGGGLSEYLQSLKTNYNTARDLSAVMDGFYNGELNRGWVKSNPDLSFLTLNEQVADFSEAWQYCDVVSKSVATVWDEIATEPMQAFAAMKADIDTNVKLLNGYRRDADSYKRRHAASLKKLQAAPSEKMEEAHENSIKLKLKADKFTKIYSIQNAKVRKDFQEAKVAKDEALELMAVAVAACQLELIEQTYDSLKKATANMPKEKMTAVRQRVKDVIKQGGPDSISGGDKEKPTRMSMNFSIGGSNAMNSKNGRNSTQESFVRDSSPRKERNSSPLRQPQQQPIPIATRLEMADAERERKSSVERERKSSADRERKSSTGSNGSSSGSKQTISSAANAERLFPTNSTPLKSAASSSRLAGPGRKKPAPPSSTSVPKAEQQKSQQRTNSPTNKSRSDSSSPTNASRSIDKKNQEKPASVQEQAQAQAVLPPSPPKASHPAPAPTTASTSPSNSAPLSSIDEDDSSSRESTSSKPNTNSSIIYCKALFDNEPDDETELGFVIGDRIELVRRDQSGWWEGKIRGGAVGLFPANYVEEEK